MEIRDFAEQVLFAETLEEKLEGPSGGLTDCSPGLAIEVPDQPGRPEALRFSRAGERSPFPKASQLHDEEERGRLLHFFANHELLAAELMALVLLKFPDAPAAFRLGVAKTLQEEQMHTRLYQRRLDECGVEFGQQPVNGFFWKAVSTMETPVDYVSRLSLTFEQANLDYSRHFARVFEKSGDPLTAKVLDKIYRDEISHVGYGLEWFRRWKASGQSDWEAYRARLSFPLSASRAKGGGANFNREGRELAGLDGEFIDLLEVFTQSKGRTPNIFHFNPQAEWVISQDGKAPGLSGTMRALSEDLSALTLYLGRQDDVALLAKRPSLGFLQKLRLAGFALPEIQERDRFDLGERKLGQLRPWAWSPDSTEVLQPLIPLATQTEHGWSPAWKALHSKVFSTRLAREGGFGNGHVCQDPVAIEQAVREIGVGYVLKAPFGLAGKGLRFIDPAAPPADLLSWQERVLGEEGAVIVEPFYERVFDFSVQYSSDRRLLGYTALHNDPRGRFLGCSVGKNLTASAGEEVTRFFYAKDRKVQRFYEEILPALLQPHLDRLGYPGPMGVDAMIARGQDGRLVHHPVIEINPRYTMGRLTLELSRQVVKGVRAVFQILTKKHLKAQGAESWENLADALETESPLDLVTYQNGQRRLQSGTLVLNDPSQAQAFLAILRVGQEIDPLLL